jgi:hypothetical protein
MFSCTKLFTLGVVEICEKSSVRREEFNAVVKTAKVKRNTRIKYLSRIKMLRGNHVRGRWLPKLRVFVTGLHEPSRSLLRPRVSVANRKNGMKSGSDAP